MQLMAIPGKSRREAQVAQFVTDFLRESGISNTQIKFDSAHRRTPEKGDVGNLVVKLPGSVGGKRRMLMAHLDTVPTCLGSEPVRRGKQVFSKNPNTGLGADDRAGVAVVLNAIREIQKRNLPHPPLTLLFLVQEEIGLQGARTLSLGQLGKPKMAFNFDGGSPQKITIGATGGYRMKIDVRGLASHAGNAPERGVSAIAIAAEAISSLHSGGWHGQIEYSGKQGTSNIGVIHGGAATNVVADRVDVLAEARSHQSTFRRRIVREIEKAFRQAARSVKSIDGKQGTVHFDGRLDYESFCLPVNAPCVRIAQMAVEAIGLEPQLAVANGGLDANWTNAHGIPTVSLGCGQKYQHTVNEALDIQGFEQACQLALRLATEVDDATG